ncbi:MAG TPA: enoyl-CoA hydratase-related protein [Thermoplasmata archaeon]|nr:enoyl-CoA hydratase-related protein [Thermoplasmata archaeon]
MPGFVKTEMEDRLAVVTINRPEALNALNATVLRELSMTFEHLSMAADVGAIILTGAGDKAFVAGADIKEMAGLSALEMRAFSEVGRRLGDTMAGCSKPIIAAINGYALGGGCELALACDIRIASDRARLGQPEVNIGIIPGFGGSQRLPRIVGPGWAAELVYTGEMVDAATAERIGLVNRVVPPDRLLEEAKALARKILEKSPAAIALAKACLRSAMEMPLSAGLDFETAAFGVVGSTRDKAEGMRAFIEKRKPTWTGA